MISRLWCFAAAALSIAAASQAWAQLSAAPTETAATDEEESLPPRPIVPRRSDRRPPGIQTSKTSGPPDWQAVKTSVDDMRSRDAAFDRQMRAMTLSRVVPTEERERLRPKGVRAAAPQQFQRVAPDEVLRTRVPLLAPVTAETVSNLRIAARENAYTAFGDLPGGGYFELIGTRMRVVGGPAELMKARTAQRKRAVARLDSIDAQFLISRHEQGVDLSFSKFNAAYLITIYCPKADTDERCAKDDFILSFAENLALLNEGEGDAQ